MHSAIQSRTRRVSGAPVYYEMRDSGPLLLMIAGGGGNGACDFHREEIECF
jgi:hypothetical protein